MKPEVKIFPNAEETAEHLAESLYEKLRNFNSEEKKFNIALSGGSTPKIFFRILAEKYSQKIKWGKINLFWGDERCVPPDDRESNYRMTKETLLNFISIPNENIFRIKGEDDPFGEVKRYSKIIKENVPNFNGLPSFNLMLLGLGEDGHTASIFPNQISLLNSEKICEVSVHPVLKQKRITLTGRIINNSEWIVFLVTGEKKSMVVSKILKEQKKAEIYPAYLVNPSFGKLEWYLDKDAAKYL
jgi:6-phosphogluconolactonase